MTMTLANQYIINCLVQALMVIDECQLSDIGKPNSWNSN